MQLSIYSLQKPIYRKDITLVNLKAETGELTILDNHEPLITFLRPGPIRITGIDGVEEVVEARGGFLEVLSQGMVNILID